MCKLNLEKAEEPVIKLPTSVRSQRNHGNSRKTSTSISLTTLKPLTVWITTGKLFKRWEYQTNCCQEATVRIRHGRTDWFKIGKGVCQGYVLLPCLFSICRVLCHAQSLGCVSEIPWTVARQAPLSLGILQARILEWVAAMPSFMGSSQPRD